MVSLPENIGVKRLAHHLFKSALHDLTNPKAKVDIVYEAERWLFGDGRGSLSLLWASVALDVDIEFLRNIADRALGAPGTLDAYKEDAYD